MPDANADARSRYDQAVERYQEAEQALTGARRLKDMEGVTSLLEEGRWAMSAAKARFAGEPEPERRSPCFFDPRHGPSVKDVEWAPPDGEPRPVPVCAADAHAWRTARSRRCARSSTTVAGCPTGRPARRSRHGPAGFFAFGALPALFFGSALGAGGYYGGDYGTSDAGDAGGGDFGGGFGGGDFGGGFGDGGGGGF